MQTIIFSNTFVGDKPWYRQLISDLIPQSGIACTDECPLLYDKLRLRKYCRYIVFNIEKVDGVETIVKEREVKVSPTIDKQGPRDETWEQMIDSLPAYEPRFVVYDFEYTDDERRKHADLLFITW